MTINDMLAEIESRAKAAVMDDDCMARRVARPGQRKRDIPRLVAALRVADSSIRREEAAAQSAGRVSQAMRLRGTMREIEAALRGDDHAAE